MMSRLAIAALAAATLLLGQAPPVLAGIVPTPPPLPSPPPLPIPTPPTLAPPLPISVNPPPTAAGQLPVDPSLAGDAGGAGADGSAGASPADQSSAASQAPPAYVPPPDERAALPPEPERYDLEGQQAQLRSEEPSLDQQDGPQALAAGGGDGQFVWPIAFSRRPPITQRFGCTDVAGEPYSPDCVTHRFHTGIDLGIPTGTPVYASAPGVAHVYRSDRGYGNYVVVMHGNSWSTLYAHLSDVLVREGQVVGRGEPVGRSGSTGFSTGPHLHFEIRYGQSPVDPCAYLCR
jgi:murein DD-endopeptidase MepM/ murein hydrolase activator NlpD